MYFMEGGNENSVHDYSLPTCDLVSEKSLIDCTVRGKILGIK
jgi:hypothetical protein